MEQSDLQPVAASLEPFLVPATGDKTAIRPLYRGGDLLASPLGRAIRICRCHSIIEREIRPGVREWKETLKVCCYGRPTTIE